MTQPRPVAPADSQTQAFWDATREGRLTIQRCTVCGHAQHYPRAMCTACGSTGLAQADAAGAGTIVSYTTVHRSPHPAFTPPYVVVLVRLEEGPVLLSNLTGAAADAIRCGIPVRLVWEDLPDGRKLPLFRPVDGE